MKKVKKKALLVTLITLTSVLIDQLTKIIVFLQKEQIGNGIKIWDFLNIVYVENRGISFGIFSDLDASFIWESYPF